MDEPRGGEERSWQDRETESIPRARSDSAPVSRSPGGPGGPPEEEPGDAGPVDEGPEAGPGDRPVAPEADGDTDEIEVPARPGAHRVTDVDEGEEYPPPDVYVDDRMTEEVIFPDERFIGSEAVGASLVVGEPPITEEELSGLRGGMGTPLTPSRRVVPLEDEPTPLVQRYLFPTEKFRGEWRRHPIELAKEIGIAVGATILLGLVAGYLGKGETGQRFTMFLVLGWFAVLVWTAWQIADWWFDRFILTNKRVMVVSGIITRNVAMMPLQRVTDMKYVQSPLGRVLNYGTFELESAGQEQALRSIPHLPSPNELYLRIVEEMYEPEAVEARLAGAPELTDDGT